MVGYDDVGSLPGLYFSSRIGFMKAYHRALSRGGGYRVFYAGDQTKADYSWWCEVVWENADGDHIQYVVSEELAGPSPGSGDAPEVMARLWSQGRKYGLRTVGTTQRPPQICKDFYTQSRIKWVGQQDLYDVPRMARVAGVTGQQARDLVVVKQVSGQFFRSEGSAAGGELVTVKFRPKTGVRWMD